MNSDCGVSIAECLYSPLNKISNLSIKKTYFEKTNHLWNAAKCHY